MESNDSPEIPDRGETLDIPGLPSGGVRDEFVIGHYCHAIICSSICESNLTYSVTCELIFLLKSWLFSFWVAPKLLETEDFI